MGRSSLFFGEAGNDGAGHVRLISRVEGAPI